MQKPTLSTWLIIVREGDHPAKATHGPIFISTLLKLSLSCSEVGLDVFVFEFAGVMTAIFFVSL